MLDRNGDPYQDKVRGWELVFYVVMALFVAGFLGAGAYLLAQVVPVFIPIIIWALGSWLAISFLFAIRRPRTPRIDDP
jgi:hypothetical protein